MQAFFCLGFFEIFVKCMILKKHNFQTEPDLFHF